MRTAIFGIHVDHGRQQHLRVGVGVAACISETAEEEKAQNVGVSYISFEEAARRVPQLAPGDAPFRSRQPLQIPENV